MKLKIYILFFVFLIFSGHMFFAQNIDSLKLALKNAKHDTTRCVIISKLVEAERDPEEQHILTEKIQAIAEQNLKSSQLNEPVRKFFLKYLGIALSDLGSYHQKQGKIVIALELYEKSLKIREQSNDKYGIANSLYELAGIYNNQGDEAKALEYLMRSLKLLEEINDKVGIGHALNNIGRIYKNRKDYEKANEYFEKSLKVREENGDKNGVAISLNNIGTLCSVKGDRLKAIEYFSKSLAICREIGNPQGIGYSLINIAIEYYKQKNYTKALEFAFQAMSQAKKVGYPQQIFQTTKVLSDIYEAKGDYKNALATYQLHIRMKDSINNEETQKASVKSQLKYEYEKKALGDSIKTVEEKKVSEAKLAVSEASLKQEKTQRFALYGGLVLVLIFAGFMFNRFKITQKQKNIIELKEKETQQQKHIIEEKHKEITDSINYAERIQRSFLATNEILNENLTEYFILFKPKDIVSGDFYWASYTGASEANGQKDLFYLATADSTGHGVPGAIMSLLNITSLEKAIEHYHDPAEILSATRQTIIERLKKDGSTDGGKDGMDCSLIAFDFINKQLHVAAAHNPVWIIRPNSPFEGGVRRTADIEFIEIKPDKMPVGKNDRENEPYTLHVVDVLKGDIVYTLTDGFPDQFGGPKGKKFMSKNLKELLVNNAHLPLQTQKDILDTTLKEWIGSLEQVDDITIVGVRI